jgi:hypothetical protein
MVLRASLETHPQQFLGSRIKLSANLAFELKGEDSWAGIWVKVDLKSSAGKPRTFHLDNMADRKLTGSSRVRNTRRSLLTLSGRMDKVRNCKRYTIECRISDLWFFNGWR